MKNPPRSAPSATTKQYYSSHLLREKPIHLSRATSLLQNRDDLRLNWLPGDFDVFIRNVNVDFGSNAKLSFEINPGLNRKTNSRNDAPRIAGFEIVDVDAVAVSFFANRMAGAMRELFPETCACNYAALHIIDFRAANRFVSPNILAHEIDRRISGFPHDIENA